ncbi:hypothetical protein FOZ60_012431 [Perkinsus olseni]|uniref:Uncharacterized protein n=1 Tax=Perkinsus olseni TaxID=32597 RepID=A0A7J6NBV5_PEROL|nr:hypothetical protein FOZ60_012431 [Perkinsus olseni]
MLLPIAADMRSLLRHDKLLETLATSKRPRDSQLLNPTLQTEGVKHLYGAAYKFRYGTTVVDNRVKADHEGHALSHKAVSAEESTTASVKMAEQQIETGAGTVDVLVMDEEEPAAERAPLSGEKVNVLEPREANSKRGARRALSWLLTIERRAFGKDSASRVMRAFKRKELLYGEGRIQHHHNTYEAVADEARDNREPAKHILSGSQRSPGE